jgi:hypothetical protein
MYQNRLVTLAVGAAIPAYAFGNENGTNVSSFANVGTNVNLQGAYFYSWHAGIAVMVNYNINTVDSDGLAEEYLNSSPAFKTVTAKSESFHDIAGLMGVVFDIPVNDIFSLTFKMLSGLRYVYKPATLIKTTTVFASIDYYETSANETIFALFGTAGAKALINDHFSLHLDASYMGSTYDFTYLRNSKEVNQEAHIGILAITAGVSYNF